MHAELWGGKIVQIASLMSLGKTSEPDPRETRDKHTTEVCNSQKHMPKNKTSAFTQITASGLSERLFMF